MLTPNQYFLPLIYVLLRRVWHVLRQARCVRIHPEELTSIVDSFEV